MDEDTRTRQARQNRERREWEEVKRRQQQEQQQEQRQREEVANEARRRRWRRRAGRPLEVRFEDYNDDDRPFPHHPSLHRQRKGENSSRMRSKGKNIRRVVIVDERDRGESTAAKAGVKGHDDSWARSKWNCGEGSLRDEGYFSCSLSLFLSLFYLFILYLSYYRKE